MAKISGSVDHQPVVIGGIKVEIGLPVRVGSDGNGNLTRFSYLMKCIDKGQGRKNHWTIFLFDTP